MLSRKRFDCFFSRISPWNYRCILIQFTSNRTRTRSGMQSFVVRCFSHDINRAGYSRRMQIRVIQQFGAADFGIPFFKLKIGYVPVCLLSHLLLAAASFEWQLVMRIRR